MKSHTPTQEEREWMDAISDLGCAVCHREWGVTSPAEIHHLQGKVKLGSHLFSIPLCPRHHRGGEDVFEYTSRHPFKKRFEARYGTELEIYEWTQHEIERRRKARLNR